VAVQSLLVATADFIDGVAGKGDDVKRVHHRNSTGEFVGGGSLVAGEAIQCDDFHAVSPSRLVGGQDCWNALVERPSAMLTSHERPVPQGIGVMSVMTVT